MDIFIYSLSCHPKPVFHLWGMWLYLSKQWKSMVSKITLDFINFHCMKKETFFKKYYFVFHRKKVTQVWNDLRLIYDERIWHFSVNHSFKGLCVCYAILHSCSLKVALCGKVWVWLNMCVKMYMCVTMCVSRRRSEPFCLSWLALILFSGLKPFFLSCQQTWHMYTRRRSHTLYIFTHQQSSHSKEAPQTGPSLTHTHTHRRTQDALCILHLPRPLQPCGKHAHQRFAGTLQLVDSSDFMTQHVYSKKAQLCVTPFSCARVFHQWDIRYKVHLYVLWGKCDWCLYLCKTLHPWC